MHLHPVAIDIERVRSQLSNELSRAVSDSEVILWLRRCGYVQHNGKWVSDLARITGQRLVIPNPAAFPERLNAF